MVWSEVDGITSSEKISIVRVAYVLSRSLKELRKVGRLSVGYQLM